MKPLAIAAVLSIAIAFQASGCNLAPNPSFEDGTSGPAGWRLMSFQGQEEPVWDTSVAHTGQRSVRIDVPAASGEIVSGWHSDPIPVDVSKQYCFSVWAKATPSLVDRVAVVLQIRELDVQGNPDGLGVGPYNERSVSTEWAELRTVKPRLGEAIEGGAGWGPETASAILDINFFAPDQRGLQGTIWLDDVFFGDCAPEASTPRPPSDLSVQVMFWDFLDPQTGQMSGGCGSSLTWQDNSDSEDAFRIERRAANSQEWEPIEGVPADSTTYFDSGRCDGDCYRVAAVGAAGISAYSNEACSGQ
jgi:hypothetical protein